MKIGIRREDKNIWEGRVPLVPADIEEIKQKHEIEFIVQPSTIRAFKDSEFEQVGCSVSEDLSDCDLIIAVKEIPVDFFKENKNYLFFSHTIKGQKENMQILKIMMEKNSTLLDYEKIVDDNNKRIVFFGKYAGIAGMIDSFYAYGQKLKFEGIDSPFQKVKHAFDYKEVSKAKVNFAEIAEKIKNGEQKFPVIIGIAGYGNVSKGSQEIIDLFPCKELTPRELVAVDKSTLSTNCIYKVVFKEQDLVEAKSGEFNLTDYYNNPQNYQSIFTRYLNKIDIFINAVYWDNRYPKLITCDYLKQNQENLKNLRVIGDISCDVNGGVECTRKSTNTGEPFFVYEPEKDDIVMGIEGNGPAILAVDNLPGEIARDSSTFFSNILKNYIFSLTKENLDSLSIPEELNKAVIVHKGKLMPDFKYLEEYLKEGEK